ncbi:hypothetical protein PAEPH01_1984 [Pancytospora epiphaga]|nr:hypothetical protein PAEPH01_1984 [Pancytospora epiphaga]
MVSAIEGGVVAMCTGAGIFAFGVIALFDKALMTAGNLLFIIGALLVSRSSSLSVFKSNKLPGTVVFLLGIVALFLKLSILGFLLEIVGMSYVFKKSLPSFRTILFRLFFGKAVKTN